MMITDIIVRTLTEDSQAKRFFRQIVAYEKTSGFEDVMKATPAAVITLGSEKPFDNRTDSRHSDRVISRFGVAMVLKSPAKLSEARKAITQAIHNKKLPELNKPISFISGRALPAKKGFLAYEFIFETVTNL